MEKWKENWFWLNTFIVTALAFNLIVFWRDTDFSGFIRAWIVMMIFVIWIVINHDFTRNRIYGFLEKRKIRLIYLWSGTIAVYYIIVILMDLVG